MLNEFCADWKSGNKEPEKYQQIFDVLFVLFSGIKENTKEQIFMHPRQLDVRVNVI